MYHLKNVKFNYSRISKRESLALVDYLHSIKFYEMSNHLNIIKQLYDYFAAKDMESIRNLFDEQISWKQMDGFPNGGHHIGADAIFKNVFQGFSDHWTGWKAVIEEFKDAGDTIFAIGYYEGTYNTTQKSMRAAFIHKYVIANNKVISFEQYTDTKLVADAMS